MLTNGLEVMKYVKASAGRAGINVIFETKNHPRHDGSTIYLPAITADTTELQLKEMMTSTDHEVAHDRFSSFEVLKEKNIDTSGSMLGIIWNCVEDSRINCIEANQYYGFKELWEEVTPNIIRNLVLENKTNPSSTSLILSTLFKWDCRVSRDTFPNCAVAGEAFESDPKLLELLGTFDERLHDLQYILDKRDGSEASYKLAEDICKSLGIDPKSQTAKTTGKGGADEEEIEAEGEEESAEGEEKEAKESEHDKEKEDTKDEWKIVKVKIDPKVAKRWCDHDKKMRKIGTLHDTDPYTETPWTLTPLDDFSVIDYHNETVQNASDRNLRSNEESDHFITVFNKRVATRSLLPENFANQVRRLVQVRAHSRQEFGVKKGKLDQSRLSRIAMDTPGFNERIFKRKIINNTLNTAITVLVDMSGSMSGDKALYACQSTLLLNHVFNTLNIPLEILGFTDAVFDLKPSMFVWKTFNTGRISREQLLEYFARSSRTMNGNPDGENILWAYNRLVQRKEKRRILIVMSDGMPAASKSGSPAYFTKKVIDEIEQAKKVDLFGLGICHDAVRKYYSQNSVINSPEEIPTKLLELIERKLT